MKQIDSILASFQSISLEEMDRVKLMERTDTKYIFPFSDLPKVLNEMLPHYRLLEINHVRCHRYESLYYDTPDFQLYAKHQRGQLNRHKIRFRRYIDSGGQIYFEVKFKNNKGRTIKKRIMLAGDDFSIDEVAGKFLKDITSFESFMLQPKLWANYYRMTFVNKCSPERLTLDVDLEYVKTEQDGFLNTIKFPQMVIAEAKRDKASFISPFIRMMRKRLIREGAISKYCYGVFHLFDSVKKNRFKEKVRYISKITGAITLQPGT